jgi:hypothetical protein
METNILYTHITAAALFAYLMDHLQRWGKIPWINRETTKLNTGIRLVLSFLATVGIHWTWGGTWTEGRQIVVAIPAIGVLGHALWNWAGQFAMQHFGERVLDVGRTWKIDPKVFNDLVEAIASKIQGVQAVQAVQPVAPSPHQ